MSRSTSVLNPGGYELGLLPDADPAEGALTYWGVDDVNGAVDSALEAGATLDAEPTDVGEGIITASVRTPDGSSWGSSTTHTLWSTTTRSRATNPLDQERYPVTGAR